MQRYSVPGIEELIRGQMVRKTAVLVDKAFFLGLGASSELRGLFAHPTVATRTVSFSGVVFGPTTAETFSTKCRAMFEKLRDDSIDVRSVRWAAEPKVLQATALVRDAQNRPLFLEHGEAETERLFGRQIEASAFLKNSDTTNLRFAVGDFSQSLLVNFGPAAFAVSDSHNNAFSKGQRYVRLITGWDAAVLEPLAFVLATAFSAASVVPG